MSDIAQRTYFEKKTKKIVDTVHKKPWTMGRGKNIPETDQIVTCALHKEGFSYRLIVERIGCCYKAVGSVVNRSKKIGMFKEHRRAGRSKICANKDVLNLTKSIRENRKASSSLRASKWRLSS